ncbi:MAG: hypothetical protein J5I94_20690 [Phaeodactylibacter sp.]|nr:hypothetical protein [Phaeodactylibacter sp.]
MRFWFAVVLLALPFCAICQKDFSGAWKGTLTQEPGGFAPVYEFEIYLRQKGNTVTGRSYVAIGSIYAVMNLKGVLEGNTVHLTETSIVENWKRDDMEWCYKKADLILYIQGKDLKLEGPWTGNTGQSECIPGKIYLKKEAPRA